MSRRCDLTGIGVQSGNNVSHSQRKTRRRFLPNLQTTSLRSDVLGQDVKLKITVATLRTVLHNGGLDNFLKKSSSLKLTEKAKKLKRKVEAKIAASEKKAS